MQSRRRSTTRPKPFGRTERQGVSRFKPKGYENYLTIAELAEEVGKTTSWIKQLERRDRMPVPVRVSLGELSVRLYSPEMVEEVKAIFGTHKMGRPRQEVEDAEL